MDWLRWDSWLVIAWRENDQAQMLHKEQIEKNPVIDVQMVEYIHIVLYYNL